MRSDYRELAQELFEMRHDNVRMEAERKLTRLTEGKRFILDYLLNSEGDVYPKQLSEDMGVSTARIAAILRRLESRGMVTRTTDPDDNRQTIVSITEKGRSFASARHEEVIDWFAGVLEHLGPEDAREFIRLKQKVVVAMAEEAEELASAR